MTDPTLTAAKIAGALCAITKAFAEGRPYVTVDRPLFCALLAAAERCSQAELEVAKLRHVERAARGVVRQFDDAGEAGDGELIDALAALDAARDGSKA